MTTIPQPQASMASVRAAGVRAAMIDAVKAADIAAQRFVLAMLCFCLSAVSSASASVSDSPSASTPDHAATAHVASSLAPDQTRNLGFRQRPGAALPLDAAFRDEHGRPVRLGDYFRDKPVLLVLEYLHCRSLCSRVLMDAARALGEVPLTAGRDYEVVAISIDPREGPADARAARAKYFPTGGAGWHFLTGIEPDIRSVADTVGFPFRYDSAIDQYAHPAGITVATSKGNIARYVLGLGYRPLDVRLALTEAGKGKVSSPAANLLLLCYHYDPVTGRYGLAIQNATRGLCAATVLGLGFMVFRLTRRKGVRRDAGNHSRAREARTKGSG
jgi:protein SCO1